MRRELLKNANEHVFRDLVWALKKPHYYVRYVAFDYKQPSAAELKADATITDKLLYMEFLLHNFCELEGILTGNTNTGCNNLSLLRRIIPSELGRYEVGYWLFCQLMGNTNFEEVTQSK